MKRKAYIGLSSPTAYFYNPHSYRQKESWDWNPILESPQGLITLFDELWFLNRQLCPITLRKEPFVKFIDEDSDYIQLISSLNSTFSSSGIDGLIQNTPIIENYIDKNNQYQNEQFNHYSEVIKHVYGKRPGNNAPIDNHSHGMNICGSYHSGNSMSIDLIAYDIAFLSNAGIANIELITNRFNSNAFKTTPVSIKQIQISQGITLKRIPVLQTPKGPIIDRIESIRENKFLIDFRDKISTLENPDDFTELVIKVEQEFKNYRNNILINKQSSCKLGTSIANNALSFVVGTIIPGASEIKSLKSDNESRKFNWTGFIASIEQ